MKKWLLIFMSLSLAKTAIAFVLFKNEDGEPLRWHLDDLNPLVHPNVVNRKTKTIQFHLSKDGWSEENFENELNSIRSAAAQWQAIPDTILKFKEGNLLEPGVDINGNDNQNVIYWAKEADSNGAVLVNNERSDISGTLAVTFPTYFEDHTIVEADMVFNGVNQRWFTDYTNTFSKDNLVEAVALHEFGHFIGIQHSPLGAASMFSRTVSGVSVSAGLTLDEVAAVQSIYGIEAEKKRLGSIVGSVTLDGNKVFGAVVIAEDKHGNIVQSAVTDEDGSYELLSLSPNQYHLRVSPLHSPQAIQPLVRDIDISVEHQGANVNFLPTEYNNASVTSQNVTKADFAVVRGNSSFFINAIRPATTTENLFELAFGPFGIKRTGEKQMIGVYSPNLPTNKAILRVSGDGITYGNTTFDSNVFAGYNLITVEITVEKNAVPGVRSLYVEKGNERTYANGFIEILPDTEDFDFDGLNDSWQRKNFPVFASKISRASADPDADGYSNQDEYFTGKDPND
ncbi:MAG: carboxypeptidase regulatory-like domain-containing protein, partial [Verrucomicrobiota bacterium]|nr:carboxypeptidase regulatory-like domain-containing protein [Verrucomicrobiota bacterium]